MLLERSYRRVLGTAMFVCLAFASAGCGGGGGDGGGSPVRPPGGNGPGGSGYTGSTTPATLSTASTPRLGGALVFELGYGFGQRPLSVSIAGLGPRKPGALKSTASRALKSALRARAQALTLETCADGGTVDIDDRTEANGTGIVVLTFDACNELGVITDGRVQVHIDAYDAQFDAATDLTYSYEDFSLTVGSYVTELGGTIRYVYNSIGYTTTYNTLARFQPEGIQHRLVNMVIESVYGITEDQQSVRGRFYHSTHGYIDVDTTQWLFVDIYSNLPRMGVMRLDGAGAALAYLEFDGTDRIALSLDTNADGVAEAATLGTSQTLLSAINQPPLARAGDNVSIEQGGTVVLDGSGSIDWEGNAISYTWSLAGGPGLVDALPVDAAQTTLTLTAAGHYAFELTVRDATGSSTDLVGVEVIPNATPIVQAGENRTVIANTLVTIEGSATDAESDPIQYVWTRNFSPPGSVVPDTVAGARLDFTPDVAGLYTYTLRASDQYGYSEDTVEILASPLLTVGYLGGFYIDASTTEETVTRMASVEVNSSYVGPPVTLSFSSDAAWLDIVSAPTATSSGEPLVVRIDPSALETMANGEYTAAITVGTEAFGTSTAMSTLNLQLPMVTHMVPYVGYADRPSDITLYGASLTSINGRTLTINGAQVENLATNFDNFARVALPALPTGVYTITIDNELGVARPMARFVVRDAPVYVDGEVEVAGPLASMDYDAERDAFFAVTSSPNQLQRLRYRDGAWETQPIAVPNPLATTLSATGDRLYVTTSDCAVFEVDAETLQIMSSTTMGCYIEVLGFVAGFADGRVLVVDTDQWSTLYLYPGLETSWSLLPSIHGARAVLNYGRDRLIWAEGPSISPPNELYLFDARTGSYQQIMVNDASTYFLRNLLAISGDGSTVLHRGDVYLEGQFVGSLEGVTDAYAVPAVTMRGDRAVIFDPSTRTLGLFSLAGGPTFPWITDVSILDGVDVASGTYILPTDDTVFVFGTSLNDPDPNVNRMHVRNLPD